MTNRLPRLFLLLLVLLGGALLVPDTAHAADPVTCTATVSTINFGTFDPTSAAAVDVSSNLHWSCTSYTPVDYNATVCFNIGNGPLGLNGGRRQITGPGGNLGVQIYTDGARTNIWGSISSSTYPNPVQVDFSIPSGTVKSGDIPVYARLFGSQPAATQGTYSSTFSSPEVAITGMLYTSGSGNCTSAGSDAGNFSPMTLTTTVQPSCTVNASDLDFGTIPLLTGNHDGTSSISVRCVSGTSYKVGLDNGIHAAGSQRQMLGPGGLISYALYRNPNHTGNWRNSGGSRVSGTGSGVTQDYTIYGRVPAQTTPSAGIYQDTITVLVTY